MSKLKTAQGLLGFFDLVDIDIDFETKSNIEFDGSVEAVFAYIGHDIREMLAFITNAPDQAVFDQAVQGKQAYRDGKVDAIYKLLELGLIDQATAQERESACFFDYYKQTQTARDAYMRALRRMDADEWLALIEAYIERVENEA